MQCRSGCLLTAESCWLACWSQVGEALCGRPARRGQSVRACICMHACEVWGALLQVSQAGGAEPGAVAAHMRQVLLLVGAPANAGGRYPLPTAASTLWPFLAPRDPHPRPPADPSQRPSARDLLHHPWVRASGMDPEGLLRCNDAMVEHAAAHPLPPEVAREVQAILQEAVRKPPTPHTTVQVQCSAAVPVGGGAQAPMPPHACPTRSWKRLFGGLFRKRAGA